MRNIAFFLYIIIFSVLFPGHVMAGSGAEGWINAGTFALVVQLGAGISIIFLAWIIKEKLHIKIPKILQGVFIWITAFIVFRYVLQPPIPFSLLAIYMGVSTIAILLYISLDQESWESSIQPIKVLFLEDHFKAKIGRYVTFTTFPALIAYGAYDKLIPKFEEPVELRTVHPAPPASIDLHGNIINLQTVESPVRVDDAGKYLAIGKESIHLGKNAFEENAPQFLKNVRDGGKVFFGTAGCFLCHGDNLDGKGMFAFAFNPIPANFTDAGTIAQLQESFVLWRVSKGGPGLSREGFPWASAMPPWEKHLTSEEIWKVVLFEYWHTEFYPRVMHE